MTNFPKKLKPHIGKRLPDKKPKKIDLEKVISEGVELIRKNQELEEELKRKTTLTYGLK